MKFIVDEMCGRLAHWLRILGYNTMYVNNFMIFFLINELPVKNEFVKVSEFKYKVFLNEEWHVLDFRFPRVYLDKRDYSLEFIDIIDEALFFSNKKLYVDIDPLILKLVKATGRILLTRDRQLAKTANGILLRSSNIWQQLSQLKNELNISTEIRTIYCPKCGARVRSVSKDEIADLVFESTLHRYNEFWFCDVCKSVYWPGYMWRNMQQNIKNVQ